MRAHKTKLTVQLVVTMGLVVMGTVLLCCFLNHTFLLKYYMNHKEKELLSGFEVIRAADSKEKLRDDSFDVTFEKICKLAVETCYWALFEVDHGKWTITYEPKKKLPIEDFLREQGRFKHLFKPGNEDLIAQFQAEVDRRWEDLQYKAAR